MNKENKHHDHHESAKHLAYAGLATATLVGGLGGAPIVLAKEINNERTELATKSSSTETPVVAIPDTLSKSATNSIPVQSPIPKKPALSKAIKNSTSSKQQSTNKILPSTNNTNSRVGLVSHVFTKSDFTFDSNGTTITGLTQAGADMVNSTTWNGNLTFSPELSNVISIGGEVFANRVNILTIDFSNLTSLTSIIYYAFRGCTSVTALDFSPLTNLTTIDSSAFAACSSLTTINFGGLKSLTTIGYGAFNYCTNLTSINFTGLTNLTTLGTSAFDTCTSLPSIDLSPLTSLITINQNAFNNCTNMQSVNFTGLSNLTTLGGSAFAQTGLLTLDLSPLTSLSVIGEYTFVQCPNLTSINIDGLPKLRNISFSAFYECENVETINVSNLPSLLSIGPDAFGYSTNLVTVSLVNLPNLTYLNYYAFVYSPKLETVNFIDLPNLMLRDSFSAGIFLDDASLKNINIDNFSSSDVTFNIEAFDSVNAGVAVTPNAQTDLETARRIIDNANSINSFSGTDKWYIPATVIYKYLDQNDQPITKDASGATVNVLSINSRIDNTFTSADAPKIPGYSSPQLVGSSPATVTQLTQEITFKYQADYAAPFTISYVDIHGNPITNSATESGVIDNEFVDGHYANDAFNLPQETLDDDPDLANYVFKELQRSNDDGGWDTISMDNLPATYGANDGHNYRFVYSELSTVTQSYIDEAGNPITVADHHTIRDEDDANYDYTFAADTDDFYANGAPKIDGYDEPVVTDDSAPVTGKIIGNAQQVVIYQYKTIAKSGTIYRVDTDGNELAAPETFNGHINDVLDLKAKQQTFAGYELKELYSGTPSVAKKILGVTAYNWQPAHALIGTTLKYGDNDGQSYKFEYVKKATSGDKQPDKTPAATPQTPGNLPTTGVDKTPTNPPVTTPDKNKTPGDGTLPGTGGDKPINTTNITTVTKNVNGNSTADKDTDLPQSGNIANYLIPALGATLMAGLIGLYAFAKKRKN